MLEKKKNYTAHLMIRVLPETHKELKRLAKVNDITISSVIRQILERGLSKTN